MVVALKKIWIALTSPFYDSRLSALHTSDVLFFRHDNDCGYNLGEQKYSPILDSIVDIYKSQGYSTLSIANPFSKMVGKNAYNYPHSFNGTFLCLAIINRFLSFLISDEKINTWVNDRKYILWSKILKRVQPKLIIAIQPDIQLCRASRQLNFPIYDMQHGVINRDHFWYCGILKDKVPRSHLPFGFLCWDESSANALNAWAPGKGVDVIVVGNPWFQRFYHPSLSDKLVQELINLPPIFNDNKPKILVSLQWEMKFYYKEENSRKTMIMCSALEQTIKNTHHKYNWLIRMHPVQRRGEEGKTCLRYLNNEFGQYKSVDWDQTSDLPLPVILAQSDLHVTDMSTVVIEAAWGGVPSALLNPLIAEGEILADLFQEERDRGIASVLPQDANAIEEWIESSLRSERPPFLQNKFGDGINEFYKQVISKNE